MEDTRQDVAAHDRIDELEDKHVENSSKIDENTAKINDWSQFLSTPVGKIVAGMVLSLLTLFATWLSGKMDPKPIPVPLTPPVNVVIHPNDGPVVTPPVASSRAVLYLTKDVDAKALAGDAAFKKLNVTIDPTTYEAGSKIGSVMLPCVALLDANNKVIEAAPYTTVEALTQWLAKK